MYGYTVPMTASTTVIPGHDYTIKLVIGDYQDTAFDSAVFIEGGTFDIGLGKVNSVPPSIAAFTGLTVSNGRAVCFGDKKIIKAGENPIPGATYFWTKDSQIIPGENTNTLLIEGPGSYASTIQFGAGASGCEEKSNC